MRHRAELDADLVTRAKKIIHLLCGLISQLRSLWVGPCIFSSLGTHLSARRDYRSQQMLIEWHAIHLANELPDVWLKPVSGPAGDVFDCFGFSIKKTVGRCSAATRMARLGEGN